MKRALIMPLLTINSGHHHVADSVQQKISNEFDCQKVELLSYTFGKGETIVSQAYLKWITYSPAFYSKVYKRIALPNGNTSLPFKFYEKLFLRNMMKILSDYRPDVVICTHALPSHLLNILKRKGKVDVPVINIYTDYFINHLWGDEYINLHMVPDAPFTHELIQRKVDESQIVMTGIPTDGAIRITDRRNYERKDHYEILISGGAQGTGKLNRFIHALKPKGRIQYNVLCGNNQKLFARIEAWKHPQIKPFSYIQCKEQLNELYERCDGIISKPGGVTMSECLKSRLPIFIYDYLPGQEEYNFTYLRSQNLVQNLREWRGAEEYLLRFLDDKREFEVLQKQLDVYHTRLTDKSILNLINESIAQTTNENIKS
ncbi:MGDG synthase family glycosyltransferase [Pseudalkalibacillus sp. Hm43]|uniref:MGDG synthase family glycosyltransferase n=1 Tax=Pseudalkalibacillus sp. Hm43 TaxID=3450742 RepID=UPI003F420569